MPAFALTLHESLDDLRARLRTERHPERKRRLHALVLLASGECAGPKQAADHLALHRNTVGVWLKRYREHGLEALLTLEPRGPKPGSQRLMPPVVFEALKRRLQDPTGLAGYDHLQAWLRRDYGVDVPYKSLYDLVRYRLGAKLKVPRPAHPKKA